MDVLGGAFGGGEQLLGDAISGVFGGSDDEDGSDEAKGNENLEGSEDLDDEESDELLEGSEDLGCCGEICVNVCCMPLFCCCMSIACLVRLLLLPASLVLLGWNERESVCKANSILIAESTAEPFSCGNTTITPGDLYFFSCPFVDSTIETFTPRDFAMVQGEAPEVPDIRSVSASMSIEMMICRERKTTRKRKDNLGRNKQRTTYEYELEWTTMWEPGTDFRYPHRAASACRAPNYRGNPPKPNGIDLGTDRLFSDGVQVGSSTQPITLDDTLVRRLDPDAKVDLSSYSDQYTGSGVNDDIPTTAFSYRGANLKIVGDELKSCNYDQLGCIRISFKESSSTSPSVLTKLDKDHKTGSYEMPGAWGCNTSQWEAIDRRSFTKAEFIKALTDSNTSFTWILRFVGLVCCWFGVYCWFSPFVDVTESIGEWINMVPCGGYIQDALENIAMAVVCAISCPIGFSCGLFAIAVVWLFMRPLIGGLLMLACVCLFAGAVAIRTFVGKKEEQRSLRQEGL